ncbi:hypothetical protein LguiA_028700 [Lonicera macranthoides]
MEENLPAVIAKRFWSIMRVALLVLRKGISKRKLMLDLNMMMKRGKIAGKALQNLMFHHHHHHHHAWSSSPLNRRHLPFPPQVGEYEFSCSNSPANPNTHSHSLFPFHLTKRNKPHNHPHFFSCTHAHAPSTDDDLNTVVKALEMLNSEGASPELPGFGRSPTVRQLRITDSPFPLRDIDEDRHVDEAAEEFIIKFYNELRQQNRMSPL